MLCDVLKSFWHDYALIVVVIDVKWNKNVSGCRTFWQDTCILTCNHSLYIPPEVFLFFCFWIRIIYSSLLVRVRCVRQMAALLLTDVWDVWSLRWGLKLRANVGERRSPTFSKGNGGFLFLGDLDGYSDCYEIDQWHLPKLTVWFEPFCHNFLSSFS